MSEIKEDLVINYSDGKPKEFKKFTISLDNNGHGMINFEASNYLEAIVIPTMISFPSVRIYSSEIPSFVVFDLKEQSDTKMFFPRVQSHDSNGKLVDNFEKPYLSGNFVIEISNGVPESLFEMYMVV